MIILIDFNEELQKYKPILEISGVEKAIRSDEAQDMFELLQYIKKHIASESGEGEARQRELS